MPPLFDLFWGMSRPSVAWFCCYASYLDFILKQTNLTLMLSDLFFFRLQASPHCFRIFPLLSAVIISFTVISQSPLKFPLYLQFPNGVSKLTIWLSYSSPIGLAHHCVLNTCSTQNKLGERQCLVRSSCLLIQHVWASGGFLFLKGLLETETGFPL